MVSLAQLMAISFVIGFSGAATPGPLLIITIRDTLSGTWRNGAAAVLAHGFLEGIIIISIVAGLRVVQFTYSIANGIAILGGGILIVFGILTFKTIQNAQPESNFGEEITQNIFQSFKRGALATVGNGYWYVWWFSVGLAIVMRAIPYGGLGMILTGFSHWLSDLTFNSIIIILLSLGRGFLKPKTYQLVLVSCSLFMAAFGALFFYIGLTGQMPVAL
jgi:threonine/homoserine/homoserine lactone efflux protein